MIWYVKTIFFLYKPFISCISILTLDSADARLLTFCGSLLVDQDATRCWDITKNSPVDILVRIVPSSLMTLLEASKALF